MWLTDFIFMIMLDIILTWCLMLWWWDFLLVLKLIVSYLGLVTLVSPYFSLKCIQIFWAVENCSYPLMRSFTIELTKMWIIFFLWLVSFLISLMLSNLTHTWIPNFMTSSIMVIAIQFVTIIKVRVIFSMSCLFRDKHLKSFHAQISLCTHAN